MKMEDIKAGMRINGIVPDAAVEIIDIRPIGDANFQIFYTSNHTGAGELMMHRNRESDLTLAETSMGRDFSANGKNFKLAMEAQRIKLAHVFDPMMAMHSSNVEPLPHQISAVYEHMLPKMPLRFVLADDPGAGKTIMTGLLVSELIMREDTRRILIVAPGSLVDQWSTELLEKFGLLFEVFNRDSQRETAMNLFEEKNHIIARLDQVSREGDIQDKLLRTEWDLVVVDEAHKMSARQSGRNIKKTKRFSLGEKLRDRTRHLLLLTATPHNGVEKDFNNFMSLLDGERFHPASRSKTKKRDVEDVMHRVVKEDLVKFDGTKLFPPRKAETVKYALSKEEMELYGEVTDYVRDEMSRADRLKDKSRRGSVGFAMTALQRRVASSPMAIYQSLIRRHDKLKKRVAEDWEEKRRTAEEKSLMIDADFDDDDWTAEEYEENEEKIVDRATAAQTHKELVEEIRTLDALKAKAKRLKNAGTDRKWEELSHLLMDNQRLRTRDGEQRKLIIFTEYRDTLAYLQEKIRGLLGDSEAVLAIHGGLGRDKRRENQERFWHDKGVRILLATDAAGEGVNLQVASLMVNYDMPWNPNRIEQRFGRIHRIGQTEECRLWNMVAVSTREGEVFARLLEKIEQQKIALGDRVYDILGEIFEEESLRDLLWRAILRKDATPDEQAMAKMDLLFDTDRLEKIVQRDALCEHSISSEHLLTIRKKMEKAQARKLQPHFVAAFFKSAFEQLGGAMRRREPNRWEIRHVPSGIRQYDKTSRERDIHSAAPVLGSYSRVCFDKKHIRLENNPMAPPAETLHPAHPLMRSVLNLAIEKNRKELQKGTVLVDDRGTGAPPRVIFVVEHHIVEAGDDRRPASVEFQFISVNENGEYKLEGWAPYLDCRPPKTEDEFALAKDIMQQRWITDAAENGILGYAADQLATPHFEQVRERREKTLEKEKKAVHKRMQQVIAEENRKLDKAEEVAAKDPTLRMNVDNALRRIKDLDQRLGHRMEEISRQKNLQSMMPKIVSAILIISADSGQTTVDIAARREVEKRAMEAVMRIEKGMGHEIQDVSGENCGWDITAIPPKTDDSIPPSRHIEVKGREEDAKTITVTRNEILSALNQDESYLLAIVLVNGDSTKTHYVHRPFAKEPDSEAASVNYDIADLLKRAIVPEQSGDICGRTGGKK